MQGKPGAAPFTFFSRAVTKPPRFPVDTGRRAFQCVLEALPDGVLEDPEGFAFVKKSIGRSTVLFLSEANNLEKPRRTDYGWAYED
jgi:hypothetical protein